jgi:hypothetical protein
LLRKKFFVDALELFFNPLDLLPRRGTLLVIQFRCFRTGEPPMGTVHNGADQLQIADQFGGRSGRDFLVPLRFEKQPGVVQNASADRGRSPAPSRIQLAGFASIAVMLGEDRRHPLAIFEALAGHRHQKLHGHLCRDLAIAHLLLNGFRQQFHKRQPTRYPRHAAIKPPRQLFQVVSEPLLHLGEQPAHLQRGFVFGKAHRALQQYSRGLAQRPHHRFHRVPPQLLQRGNPLVAIDDYVAVRLALGCYHHDGRLLPRFGQRRQQPPLPRRMSHTQMLPAPVELMKLQLHRQAECTGESPRRSICPD